MAAGYHSGARTVVHCADGRVFTIGQDANGRVSVRMDGLGGKMIDFLYLSALEAEMIARGLTRRARRASLLARAVGAITGEGE